MFFLTSVFEKKKEKKTLNSKKYLSDKFELIKMKGYYFYLPRHTCSIFGQTVLRSIFHPKKKTKQYYTKCLLLDQFTYMGLFFN